MHPYLPSVWIGNSLWYPFVHRNENHRKVQHQNGIHKSLKRDQLKVFPSEFWKLPDQTIWKKKLFIEPSKREIY